MSTRELCYQMIDSFPEEMLISVMGVLENLCEMSGIYKKPNAVTIAAMNETESMIRTGSGQHFVGSAADFLED